MLGSHMVWMEEIHPRVHGSPNPILLTKMIGSGSQDLSQPGGIHWLKGLVWGSLISIKGELSLSLCDYKQITLVVLGRQYHDRNQETETTI